MCGIAGIFLTENGGDVDREILFRMTEKLRHRGPDDSGFYFKGNIGFGFRRLSILDLSVHGNQPFFNENKEIILVCNGEIYNYKELKNELIGKGHQFYSTCDVEIIVHLYEEYGENFIKKLNGQFAFALCDSTKNILLLVRDHVGIAPVFYTFVNEQLIFSSEIKALLEHPSVKREVDLTALDQFFSFPGLVSPRTMFKNINAVRPGHYLKVLNGKVVDHEYWDITYPFEREIDRSKNESYFIESIDELLNNSVKLRLQSDVPVGFYLSGGLDSSLIGAIIRKNSPDEDRLSFSIGFTQEDIDERKYQKLVSEQLKSKHNETIFDWEQISRRLNQAVYHAETPLKESYNTCSLALSDSVNKKGLKVILTGEGSDEIFAGYVGYRFDLQRDNNDFDPDDIDTLMDYQIREKLWGDSNFLYERNQFTFKETKRAIYSKNINESFNDFNCLEKNLIDKSKLKGRHITHKRSYIDFKLRLSDHLLADHGDRVSYCNSVEARYPFLDINLIEFVKSIPPELLINKTEKYILKKMAERYLPDSIVNRSKFAFVAPGSPYLLTKDIEYIKDYLSYDFIKKRGYFNPDTVERLKIMYSSPGFSINQTFDNDLLMIILTFNIFLELFDIPNF